MPAVRVLRPAIRRSLRIWPFDPDRAIKSLGDGAGKHGMGAVMALLEQAHRLLPKAIAEQLRHEALRAQERWENSQTRRASLRSQQYSLWVAIPFFFLVAILFRSLAGSTMQQLMGM